MKCNSSKVQSQKYKNAQAKAEAERKAMLDAMTDEEREAFLQKEKAEKDARSKRAQKALTDLVDVASFAGGPYIPKAIKNIINK